MIGLGQQPPVGRIAVKPVCNLIQAFGKAMPFIGHAGGFATGMYAGRAYMVGDMCRF